MDESVMPPAELERWLPVLGYEGLYAVSDLGRVRSRRQILRPQGGVRKSVTLYRDGRSWQACVHVLVARAFLGPPPAGHEVCHGPGGRLDNRLANLSYGTHAKNQGPDRRRDGTLPAGVRAGGAKLDDEIVRECRARVAAGETQVALAREFGVAQTTIRAAVIGKTWQHLPPCDDPDIASRARGVRVFEGVSLRFPLDRPA